MALKDIKDKQLSLLLGICGPIPANRGDCPNYLSFQVGTTLELNVSRSAGGGDYLSSLEGVA